MCSLYNLGRIKLYNVKATFEGKNIKKSEVFIGNVESGATGSIDAMLEGKKVSDGPSKVTMTLSYEDESGNISKTTKDLTLEVTEKMDDEAVAADVPEEELELGYHVFHPYRRQGYAEEACRAILDYAKNELDCPVCACAAGENTASIRLLRKLKVKYFTVCNM